jgi:hypothetical protein
MAEKEENSCKKLNPTEILITVLESGNSIELPATGYSMFPALRPGDKITVKPILNNILPQKGSVVVYIKDQKLVVHCIVKVTKDQYKKFDLNTRRFTAFQ